MNELNGKLLAMQILLTGLIARVANTQDDPLTFLTGYRDEVRAVVGGVRIAGALDDHEIRTQALASIDEIFGLMKPPPVA